MPGTNTDYTETTWIADPLCVICTSALHADSVSELDCINSNNL